MIGQLFASEIVVVEAFTDVPDEQPFPGEEDLIANAGKLRRREFVTARRCAREALGRLGYPPTPIRPGPGRDPQWPAGVTGAITHCRGFRAAAVAVRTVVAGVGIDAEPHEPLPQEVLEAVTADGEAEMLASLARANPTVHWDRLLFSAKESVYKAWYPLTRRWLEFEDARLYLDPTARTFSADLLVDGTRVDGGSPLVRMTGRFIIAGGLVATGIVVNPEK